MNLRFLTLVVGLVAGLVGHTASAQVAAPSKGGDVSLIRVTANTMELSFGNTGTGQGRILGIAATSNGVSVPLAAVDGQYYTANATYGQGSPLGKGYTVYNGTSHSIIVTGLKPNTYYYITDAEYNTDGSTVIYNTRGTSIITATRNAAPVPLPVELTAFTGAIDYRGMALLHWATATERNSDYFALERSPDGTVFAEADRVAAAGTSTQLLAYQWADPQRVVQLTYYRLRQADRDGTVHYSGVVALSPPPRLDQQVAVYPNPSAGRPVELLLQGFEGKTLALCLTDALGRPVLTQSVALIEEQYIAPLPLPQGLAAGTYLLTLAGSGNPIQKRIIISN